MFICAYNPLERLDPPSFHGRRKVHEEFASADVVVQVPTHDYINFKTLKWNLLRFSKANLFCKSILQSKKKKKSFSLHYPNKFSLLIVEWCILPTLPNKLGRNIKLFYLECFHIICSHTIKNELKLDFWLWMLKELINQYISGIMFVMTAGKNHPKNTRLQMRLVLKLQINVGQILKAV